MRKSAAAPSVFNAQPLDYMSGHKVHRMHCSQKKDRKIVKMDQKRSKRQNERPPESPELGLTPFQKTGDDLYLYFSGMQCIGILFIFVQVFTMCRHT